MGEAAGAGGGGGGGGGGSGKETGENKTLRVLAPSHVYHNQLKT